MNKASFINIAEDDIKTEISFIECATKLKELVRKPHNDELLELHGLYKQSTIGDINIKCPSFFNPSELAEWNTWNNYKGMSKITAKKRYIHLIDMLTMFN
jgi:diazepam-binding inhibitor (GABA receptor modulating acyl-CoA-binding protein)